MIKQSSTTMDQRNQKGNQAIFSNKNGNLPKRMRAAPQAVPSSKFMATDIYIRKRVLNFLSQRTRRTTKKQMKPGAPGWLNLFI